jgi:hypothetical protein
MMLIALQPKFPLGQIVVTSNALSILSEAEIQDGLRRHASADWGNVGLEDSALNDSALQDGSRLLSAYGDGSKRFWIITESDRSVTTILMPDDY